MEGLKICLNIRQGKQAFISLQYIFVGALVWVFVGKFPLRVEFSNAFLVPRNASIPRYPRLLLVKGLRAISPLLEGRFLLY